MYVCVLALALTAGAAAQSHDWKGFYVGGNLGAGFGKAPVQTLPTFSPTGYFAMSSTPAIYASSRQNVMPKGFTGGGQFGYNFQGGPWVIGFEADMGYTHLSGNRSATATYPCCSPTTYTIAQSVKTNWLFTARPRIGVAHNGVLVYGTGGLAVTSLNYKANFTDTFATAKETGGTDQPQKGHAFCGGVEFKTHPHCSRPREYLYVAGFPH